MRQIIFIALTIIAFAGRVHAADSLERDCVDLRGLVNEIAKDKEHFHGQEFIAALEKTAVAEVACRFPLEWLAWHNVLDPMKRAEYLPGDYDRKFLRADSEATIFVDIQYSPKQRPDDLASGEVLVGLDKSKRVFGDLPIEFSRWYLETATTSTMTVHLRTKVIAAEDKSKRFQLIAIDRYEFLPFDGVRQGNWKLVSSTRSITDTTK